MKKSFITELNIFLFMLWIEIMVFVSALIISVYVIKPFSGFIVDRYSLRTYDAARIALIFFFISIIQFIYKRLLTSVRGINMKTLINVINTAAISLFFISRIISRTVLSNYHIIYTGIFLSFLFPFYDDFIRIFFKKHLLKK